jgi:hypothetical protein
MFDGTTYYGTKVPSNGTSGTSGSSGSSGTSGVNGSSGSSGTSGSSGSSGTSGTDGSSGSSGTSGISITGATGAQGPTGEAGATGAQGIQGPTGNAGPTGATGATGAAGLGLLAKNLYYPATGFVENVSSRTSVPSHINYAPDIASFLDSNPGPTGPYPSTLSFSITDASSTTITISPDYADILIGGYPAVSGSALVALINAAAGASGANISATFTPVGLNNWNSVTITETTGGVLSFANISQDSFGTNAFGSAPPSVFGIITAGNYELAVSFAQPFASTDYSIDVQWQDVPTGSWADLSNQEVSFSGDAQFLIQNKTASGFDLVLANLKNPVTEQWDNFYVQAIALGETGVPTQGPAGPTGATGPAGVAGATGPQGIPGPTGSGSTLTVYGPTGFISSGIDTIGLTGSGISSTSLSGSRVDFTFSGGGGGGSTPIRLTNQTFATGGWSLVGSYYEYVFSNVNITTSTVVDFTPYNASANTVTTAQVYPYVFATGGSGTFYAAYPPLADITGDILITTVS